MRTSCKCFLQLFSFEEVIPNEFLHSGKTVFRYRDTAVAEHKQFIADYPHRVIEVCYIRAVGHIEVTVFPKLIKQLRQRGGRFKRAVVRQRVWLKLSIITIL